VAAYDEWDQNIRHYRVDKMMCISVIEERRADKDLLERVFTDRFGKDTDFIDRIPELDEKSNEEFSKIALEFAMQRIKNVPPHMHDLVMADYEGFISDEVPVMVMDKLYADGTLKPLTESERITANLIMFCDVLPRL